MGDSSETLQQLHERWDVEEYARDDLLGGRDLPKYSIPWILNYIDYFVSQSQGNESVQERNT